MIIQHYIHSDHYDFFNTLNEMQHFSRLQSHKKSFSFSLYVIIIFLLHTINSRSEFNKQKNDISSKYYLLKTPD